MNRGPFIFLGVLIILVFSWTTVVFKPNQTVGQLVAILDDDQGGRLPRELQGAAQHGKEVYQELGCIACHTQQVRVAAGMDIERGWGSRQSVARDYVDQDRVLLGRKRLGPDLANVGERRPDAAWHLLHLYNPQINSQGSNMPAYSFLFETRKIVGRPSSRAMDLPEAFAPPEGFEILPTRKAESLAAYMLSLKVDYDLNEAPKSLATMSDELEIALENAE